MDFFPNTLRRIEIFLAVALIGMSLFLTVRTAAHMATNSLSTDEFGTVGTFSSKGPIRVVTDYRAPKNHVFFNLLNSVLPGRDSFAPARARSLSIAATLLTALVLVAYAAWRGRWLEAATVLVLWSAAPQALTLSMEARGYGFLGLFAVIAALSLVEYLRAPSRRGWLWALGASVALGTYTIPTFLLFGGPLLLLLWMARRDRVTFLAGVLTFAAIATLYSPLLTQLVAEMGDGAANNEYDFVTAHALIRVGKLYLFQADDWETAALLLVLALAPFAIRNAPSGEGAGLRILAGACLIFFAALLLMRTPPVRVAAFALLPLAVAGLWAIGGWLRNRSPALLRVSLCALLGIFLVAHTAGAIRSYRFVPAEDWSLAGRAIDTAFPRDAKVDYKRFAKYLQRTLRHPETRLADYDPDAFATGRLIVADAGNKWAEGNRFTPPADVPRVVQWTIPGAIRDIVLTFRLPDSAGLSDAPGALTDGRTDTATPLDELTLRPAAGAHALVILLDRTALPRDVQGPPDLLVAGNAVVVPLQSDAEILLRATPNLKATEAWTTR